MQEKGSRRINITSARMRAISRNDLTAVWQQNITYK